MERILESALWSAGMILFFAASMTFGFWLRHGEWVWEAMSHV